MTTVELPEGEYSVDDIATLEIAKFGLEEYLENTNAEIRKIENALRMNIEVLAEVKENNLSNETKRRIAFENSAADNEELQELYVNAKEAKRSIKLYNIVIDSERRYLLQKRLIDGETREND
jgi:hypothetical protein